jgi:polyvinyl alcohol dehydrogenase (cytochrome)
VVAIALRSGAVGEIVGCSGASVPWRRRAGGQVSRVLRVVSPAAALALVAAAACGGESPGPSGAADAAADGAATTADAAWDVFGADLANTRVAAGETAIAPDTVAGLAPAWQLSGVKGVTGTPIVAGGVVYVGDWTGHVRALDAVTGDARWDRQVGRGYIGGAVALDGDHVYAGTFDGRIVALDRGTGTPAWDTPIGEHPQAVIFGSPVAVDGLVVAGVGSYEVFAGGETPSFHGHITALDAATGAVAWTFRVSDPGAGESPGVSVWSSPAVDPERGVLYIGTGQAYALPAPPRSDSAVALDLRTGRELWTTQFTAGDAWTLSRPTGLDADVGAAPNLYTVGDRDLVGVGDKDGVYHALDRDSGEVVWETRLTSGGLQGGVMAAAAVANGRVYVTSNRASTDADLVALDGGTGAEAWRIDVGAHVTGPVTWAAGVVFVSDDSGRIAGYRDADGQRLWSHAVADPAAGGIAVAGGTVYAGWGWWLTSPGPDADGGLIAFRLPGAAGARAAAPDDAGDEPGVSRRGGGLASVTVGADAEAASRRELGATIYRRSCASCHGGAGEGGSGPTLADVDERLTVALHRAVVQDGKGEMPGWEDTLTDDEIAAVVTYERTVLARQALAS